MTETRTSVQDQYQTQLQATEQLDSQLNGSTYDQFISSQGVPIVKGLYIPDLRTVEVAPWERKGGKGAMVRLDGTENINDSYVMEIPPGEELKPQRHMYEELIYIVEGHGATRIWNERGDETTFEWQADSVFGIPLNCHYQHFNGSGTERVRYYAVTSAPHVMNLFHNQDFIFNLPYDFTDRFGGGSDFGGTGKAFAGRIWDTNLVPSARTMKLQDWKERGAGGTNAYLEISDSSMCGHISEFPVGTYKKGHRHIAGAHVIIVSGTGFSLLWREDEPIQRVDWKPGSVVVPGDRWFHQHFNVGDIPARYLALRWGGKKYPVFKQHLIAKSVKEGGDQIEYEDEDPIVRQMFEEACKEHGAVSKMDEITGIPYTGPAQ